MSYIVVDVESDGPTPFNRSMVCFGAVFVNDLEKTFYGQTRPINPDWDPVALAISGFTREEHETFQCPEITIKAFDQWIRENNQGHPIFISDNPAYDWQWINYYFHKYLGRNPFGFSARRIGDLYCGLKQDSHAKWKHLRTTVHDHNPVNDAKGNAEALLKMQQMGIKFKF